MYRGYIFCEGKTAIEKFAGVAHLHTLEEVKNYNSYAGVLDGQTVMIDVDEMREAEALFQVLSTVGARFNCLRTDRGMHFYFKADRDKIPCATHVNLFVGVTADIKAGCNAYDALKVNGKEREWIYHFEDERIDVLPPYLHVGGAHFFGMGEGDGRNDALFKSIHALQREGCSKELITDLYVAINTHLFKTALTRKELAIILRDESFQEITAIEEKKKKGGRRSYYEIAKSLIADKSLTVVDGLIFADGVYTDKEGLMRMLYQYEDFMTMKTCEEVIKVLELFAPKKALAPPHYVKFLNGIWDAREMKWAEDADKYGFINAIPHEYHAEAYDKTVDVTLNKIACWTEAARAQIEEMMGYCLLTDCRYRKAFLLYGGKRNGKSTLLKAITNMLGKNNVATLDFKDLNKQFATVALRGKLANIGDDISAGFVEDVAVAKKLVSGELLTADRKFKDSVQFANYAKLIFSANDLTRFKDDSGAMMDRFVIIPCYAEFKTNDPDFNPMIDRDMTTENAAEYLVARAVAALNRVLFSDTFSGNDLSDRVKDEYLRQNNPLIEFFNLIERGPEEGETTQVYYDQYLQYCIKEGILPMAKIGVSRNVCRQFDCRTKLQRSGDKVVRVFTYS